MRPIALLPVVLCLLGHVACADEPPPHAQFPQAPGKAEPPLDFDLKKKTNIRWIADAPLGASSPITDGKHVYLTATDGESKQWLIAYDADTGKQAWQAVIRTDATRDGLHAEVFDETVFAASTPALHGKHVAALFATGDLAVVDNTGNVVWTKNLGDPENLYGYASSPIIVDGNVIVQWDTADAADLLAFELATGKLAWSVTREVLNSWATPIAIDTDAGAGKQIVTVSIARVVGHDAGTGKQLWHVDGIEADENESVNASPVFVAGRVIVVDPGNERLLAIKPDGKGDVTRTHVAWTAEAEAGIVSIPTPAAHGDNVIAVTYDGFACFRVKDGKKLWELELDDMVAGYASPIVAAGHLFLFDEDGAMNILKLADDGSSAKPKPLKHIAIARTAGATPAFHKNHIYVRTEKQLICIARLK